MDKSPCTLPTDAYGGEVEWFKPPRPVWAWVSWRDRKAERLPVMAYGATPRVVFIRWVGPNGDVDTVVWRNAVTVRSSGSGGG